MLSLSLKRAAKLNKCISEIFCDFFGAVPSLGKYPSYRNSRPLGFRYLHVGFLRWALLGGSECSQQGGRVAPYTKRFPNINRLLWIVIINLLGLFGSVIRSFSIKYRLL